MTLEPPDLAEADEDRKLRPNELVGLREWMQKDEKQGATDRRLRVLRYGRMW